MAEVTAEAAEAVADTAVRLEQRSGLLDYLPAALLNAALVVITANVYLFWAKCHVRGYIWSTTLINGRPLRYTGNGAELAKGFALALLLGLVVLGPPLAVLIVELRQLSGLTGLPTTGSWLIDTLLLLLGPAWLGLSALLVEWVPDVEVPRALLFGSCVVFLLGWFYALCVSRFLTYRYLLRNTVWNHCRGQVGGSPWRYGRRLLLPELSRWLTLGWTGPWRYVLRWRQLFADARFGTAELRFSGSSRVLYPRFALAWTALVAVCWSSNALIGHVADTAPANVPLVANAVAAVAFLLIVGVTAWYNQLAYRHVAESLTIGGLRLRFVGSAGGLSRLYLTNLLLNIFSTGLTYYYTRIRIARFIARNVVIEGCPDELQEGRDDGRKGNFGEGFEALIAASLL